MRAVRLEHSGDQSGVPWNPAAQPPGLGEREEGREKPRQPHSCWHQAGEPWALGPLHDHLLSPRPTSAVLKGERQPVASTLLPERDSALSHQYAPFSAPAAAAAPRPSCQAVGRRRVGVRQ